MSLRIAHHGTSVYELTSSQLTGRSAIGSFAFGLGMQFQQRHTDEVIHIERLWCSVGLNSGLEMILPRVECSEGLFSASVDYQNDQRLFFEFVLTGQQLEAIEARRGEGDLVLKVGLRASTRTDESLPVQTLSDESLTVPREEWLKALENSGYRKTLLFEVPVTHTDDHADALFKKAQYMIDTGLYKDAVMQCRHIIEHVEAERGDLEASKNANNASKTSKTRKEMSVEERMFSLREQVKSICQLGAHGHEEFSRSQARAVLAMTMALLSEPTVGFCNLVSTGNK